MNSKNIFGQRIREMRISAKLTQPQLGEKIGLSKQAINDIEQGRRETTITKAILLARLFDTTVHYLVGDTNNHLRPSETPFVEALFADDSDLPFSIRLKELQTEKKVSWEDILDFLENVKDTTTMGKFLALADYFDVSIDYLVGRSDNPKINK